jgi:threonine dehydrogenase-like Zn-dependent dehydrogenase
MKAVVFNGVGNISLKEVADPKIQEPGDAVIALTRSAICGTDLHMIRGTIPGMKETNLFHNGTILGHEGVGVIESIGKDVKDFAVGDRVIIPSTISCGECYYCKHDITSQCDKANPNGPDAGTSFFGGPKSSGPFDGMQAEKVRVPFADAMLIKIPDNVTDDQAILLSDILPTSYMGVAFVDPKPDDYVAVFGCGIVGLLAIACLKLMKVKTIFAIDHIPERLQKAAEQGAITINFDEEDPVKALKKYTDNKGPNKIIDAVGIDAQQPKCNSLHCLKNIKQRLQFRKEVKQVAPVQRPSCCGNWVPGDGPSQVFEWTLKAIAKAGIFSVIGVYTELLKTFSIGEAMEKNLTIRMGNCNHRAYIPTLLKLVQNGEFDPLPFISHKVELNDAIKAYKVFDKKEKGVIKVVLVP